MSVDSCSGGLFAEVIIPKPLFSLFTYSVPEEIAGAVEPGKRVFVPFGSRKLLGLVARLAGKADMDTKPIIQVVDEKPVVDRDLLSLALWTADHYFAAPGEVSPMILPRDDVRVETLVEIVPGAAPPGPRSKIAGKIYEKLLEKKGSRKLPLLAADLGVCVRDMEKMLSGGAARRIVRRRQVARPVSVRVADSSAGWQAPAPERVDLTDQQKSVVETIRPDIENGKFRVHLLHGVTGSGKTEVYASLAETALELGKSALILAPEIALADMLADRLRLRLGVEPASLHSDMSPRERNRRWKAIADGEARLIVGARSAVYAPAMRLGLIIVDEEHDTSYKQETPPRYSGRDVAIKRGSISGAPVVLGSATPSLESYHHALSGKYSLLELADRIDYRPLPRVEIVAPERTGEIGGRLEEEIAKRLEAGEQTLLFINRRGSARYVQCSLCGHVFECRNCSLSLVSHSGSGTLDCHTCGYSEPAPDLCPACRSSELVMGGAGSEKIEREVARLFPGARVARMDRDTTSRRKAAAKILGDVERGEVDILVGTQMVTKGHDYPGITLVGAINADDTLHLPDFRASERAFQLVTQAAGRAGRGDAGGLVIVQTLSAGHHSVETAVRHDFKAFYEKEAEIRRSVGYPPFSRMAFIRMEAVSASGGEAFVMDTVQPLLSRIVSDTPGVTLLGPAPAVVFKVRNRYNWRALLKAPGHAPLSAVLRRFMSEMGAIKLSGAGRVRISVDMDPVSVM